MLFGTTVGGVFGVSNTILSRGVTQTWHGFGINVSTFNFGACTETPLLESLLGWFLFLAVSTFNVSALEFS